MILDKETLKKMGYAEQVKLIEEGICPHCKTKVDPDSFTDNFYRMEFEVCGYCESCTRNMMDAIARNKTNDRCLRCGENIKVTDFESTFELRMYNKTSVCGKCQRQIVKFFDV